MKTVSLLSLYHDFSKVNMTTIIHRGRSYDILKCLKCGMEGKRFGISENLTILNKYSSTQIQYCIEDPKQMKDKFVNKWVKITLCIAGGGAFRNLTPNSIHKIITPPEDHMNGDRGVWVQGIGELVKILFNEYNDFSWKRTKFKNKT